MIHYLLSMALLATGITPIPDQSSLTILNPDLKLRETAKIRLANGLEAYLVSDPEADQSAAAMAVGAGSWSDPADYPGMAHFCEHMLFMGSKLFPNENEFSSMISDANGVANAYTAPNRTVYMFSSNIEGFQEILHRFSRFFIDPLFNPSGVQREMHAVDQEFFKNIENDQWREYMIFKETGNPDHPNAKFSTGNSQTLAGIPQEALKKWHQRHYFAKNMRLVLYSSLPMEELKNICSLFAEVPKSQETGEAIGQGELTSSKQRGHLISIQPIKERRQLTLSWELPRELSLDSAKSAELIAYALGRGQIWSLRELLKEEGLIDSLSVDVDDLGGPSHNFFQIQMQLTQKGLAEFEQAILRVFEALSAMQPLPDYFFQELNAVSELRYQFQTRQDAFHYISHLASHILDEELSTFPKQLLLASHFEPQLIAETLRILTPDRCTFTLMAPSEDPLENKERWMGALYSVKPLDGSWMQRYREAQPNSRIRIASPNPFLPKRFDLALTAPATPQLIEEDAGGIAYYARVPEFKTPEAIVTLHLSSPKIEPTARSACLAALYLDALTDQLYPLLSEAGDAGLHTSIKHEHNQFTLKIDGFSDKIALLLQKTLVQLRIKEPSEEQFNNYKERLAKDLANGAKDLAYVQARELAFSILYQDRFTRKERLSALESIRRSDLMEFATTYLDETYLEALLSGNLSLKEAEGIWLDIRHLIGSSPFEQERHYPVSTITLSANGPFVIQESCEALGNAALLLIDTGPYCCHSRASQEILSAVLREQFFDTLRTKQKTGYIAFSDLIDLEKRRQLNCFLVQSNSHQPQELLYRFELFLEETLQNLNELIPENRFAALKESLIHSLETRFRNLKDKTALWDLLAFDMKGDFTWIDRRIAGFKELDYRSFLEQTGKILSRDNRRRLALLFEGRLPEPFHYQTIAKDEQLLGDYSQGAVVSNE